MRIVCGNPVRGGFTLTELLVVVVLIGILTSVMVAEMSGTYDDALLRGAARDVMSGLGIASTRAITLAQPHAFRLDSAERKFRVTPAARGTSAESANPELVELHERKLDSRVEIQIRDPEAVPDEDDFAADERAEPGVIRFYPDGTADRREIYFRDRSGFEMVLQINPVTGRVRIRSEESESL